MKAKKGPQVIVKTRQFNPRLPPPRPGQFKKKKIKNKFEDYPELK